MHKRANEGMHKEISNLQFFSEIRQNNYYNFKREDRKSGFGHKNWRCVV